MFEILSDKLSRVFRLLGNKGKLTEKDVDEALRQVRLALLEADVNFRVVKDFTVRVRGRALDAEVLQSLSPAQQMLKIVNEELIATLGDGQGRLMTSPHPPSAAMLVGLQGGGKTTTAAKLALHLRHSGQLPLLVAADNRRPAAIEQLVNVYPHTIWGKTGRFGNASFQHFCCTAPIPVLDVIASHPNLQDALIHYSNWVFFLHPGILNNLVAFIKSPLVK